MDQYGAARRLARRASGRGVTVAEIINLRTARKAARRKADERQAEANRAKFGRTKGEKARDRIEADRLARTVDGARIDREGE